MGGRLESYFLAPVANESYLNLPAITARLTSADAQIAIGAKVHVTSGDFVSSLKQTTIWMMDAKQRLLSTVS